MLPPRDPPQIERYTQTKSKGLEKYFMQMENEKNTGVAVFVSDKIDSKTKL